MTGLCLAAAALSLSLPLQHFTLAWTHSIEKIRWEEDYRVSAAGLELAEARIRGSGAGMEPPQGALLKDGVWHYRPALRPLPALTLNRSGFVADYEICGGGRCRPLAELLGPEAAAPVVTLAPCAAR
ncbi:MAG TPA: DUF1850 domain-containing protein [Noviherbaspirillum sp.]|uniref:DUF1850 domain-containing protein n=1 Tax=Noviherbaspirillum sp. TaxID=1926288 RepID=UPI002D4387D7|nr:DUF1850 domain-containing protein [Noviherbaspirillum sp.]HYD95849.1 DUF1850 domain-containing protein [Noviherbaspirillum sp.]